MSLGLIENTEDDRIAEAEDRVAYVANLQIAGGLLTAVLALIALFLALIAAPNPGAQVSPSTGFLILGLFFAAIATLSFLLRWKIKQYRAWAVVFGGILSLLIFFVVGVGLMFTILVPLLYVWSVVRPVFKSFGAIGEMNRSVSA